MINKTKPFQLGIYGKGGIGKSTITSNLSACLGLMGYKVLQIGCDPKSDSTKLLLKGKKQIPILDIIKEKSLSEIEVEDFIMEGFANVKCAESGGPQAGVGCAGRGIITMVELLKNKGIFQAGFDYIFYDILGDVVCGGFSVPLRKGFADGIIIVTSGEFQSLFAANNICRGLGNLDSKLIGIIGNSRNIPAEKELIEEFASMINSEMLVFIPNSNIFREAEVNRVTVIEYDQKSNIAKIFFNLAKRILEKDYKLKKPVAIEDKDLEKLNLKYLRKNVFIEKKTKKFFHSLNTSINNTINLEGIKNHKINKNLEIEKEYVKKENFDDAKKNNLEKLSTIEPKNFFLKNHLSRIESKCLKNREALHGCALSGAFSITSQIKDYITLMHAPSGCGYINSISNSGASQIEKIYGLVNQATLFPRLVQTSIREKDAVFGGNEILLESLNTIVNCYGIKKIFILTACAAAIIGDDPEKISSNITEDFNCDVTVINTQGVLGGDYFQGVLEAYQMISEKFIDKNLKAENKFPMVNIINEKINLNDSDYNYTIIKKLLNQLGIKINCRFIKDTSIASIKNFKKAPISIPYDDGYICQNICNYLKQNYQVEIFNKIPVGFDETVNWVKDICNYFNIKKIANEIINKYQTKYNNILSEHKKILEGKSILIFSFNTNLNYIIKTIKDLNMKLEKICFIRSVENEEFKINSNIDVEYNFNESLRDKLIKAIKPDIVLTSMPVLETVENVNYDLIPYYPIVGFFSGLELSKKWKDFFLVNHKEGWRYEEKLFNKLQFKP